MGRLSTMLGAGYIDCYVRLAIIAHERADEQQAWHWAQKALEQCQAVQSPASSTRAASDKRDYANACALKGGPLLPALAAWAALAAARTHVWPAIVQTECMAASDPCMHA